jgi:hypothetical protein
MNGTADRSGTMFDPLSHWERQYTGGRDMPAQVSSPRPTVPKPPPPSPFPPCHADPTGPGARSLPAGASQ